MRNKSSKTPHKWLLIIATNAQLTFDQLKSNEKRTIFRKLRELLIADDPYNVPFVEMLQSKRFNRFYKFRVGNYRLFFVVDYTPINHLQYTYKGTLFLFDIRQRQNAYE